MSKPITLETVPFELLDRDSDDDAKWMEMQVKIPLRYPDGTWDATHEADWNVNIIDGKLVVNIVTSGYKEIA